MDGGGGCCFTLGRRFVGCGYWWSVGAWDLAHRMDILCVAVAVTGRRGNGNLGLPARGAVMESSTGGPAGCSSGCSAV